VHAPVFLTESLHLIGIDIIHTKPSFIMSSLLQFLNQDEYLKGIHIYEAIIKAYASYIEHTSNGSTRDEL
jgi:aminoacylase